MISLASFAFLFCVCVAAYALSKRIRFLRRCIRQGLKTPSSATPSISRTKRVWQLLLFAFGQRRMFDKPVVALLHVLIYVGFVLINLEVFEIFVDGLLGYPPHRSVFYRTGLLWRDDFFF